MYDDNYVEAKNKLASIVNDLVPKLEEYFAKADISYKADYSPYEKNRKQIREIIDPVPQVYITYSEYSTVINFKVTYHRDDESWGYLNDYHYLKTTFVKRELVTMKSIQGAIYKLEYVQKEIRRLVTQEGKLKYYLNQ